MNAIKRTFAAAELALLLPALFFLATVFVAGATAGPLQAIAHGVVTWYAARLWTLWVLLMALPGVVLVAGCAALARRWQADDDLRRAADRTLAAIRAHLATVFVAGSTLAAAVVLAIVALHVLTS